uniref:Protein sleepless n=1 Tax=Haemonchus contortus TaxID=6289 RepID=A0A7I4YMW4_HAECO|nr:Protein C15H9.9 [Haemonchus contortus]
MNLLILCLLSVFIGGVYSIQCYICNSITHPECENDYEQFLRNCPVKSFGGRKAVPPIGCRKYRQTANEETSIVRECAYLGEDVENKSNKGSAGVSRTMSQCSDRPACNPAAPLHGGLSILVIALFRLFA